LYFTFNLVEESLKDPKTNDITREFITEFLEATLQGKSVGEYNEVQTNSWKSNVNSKHQYLIELKSIFSIM
jgi:hypothetical protein